MKKRKLNDFTGFRFGNIHSSELGLTVVSSGKRYEKNLLPSPSDTTADIPGADGTYYFGQVYNNREIPVNIAFDDIDEITWRKIAQVFSNDKPQDLVFDELPFKTYKAKLKAKPDFKFVCFYDKDREKRIYKGEGKLTFVCYYPYAFGFDKYVVRAADNYYTPHVNDPKNETIQSPFEEKKKKKQRPLLTTEHYNVEGNMGQPWKSGFPTLEQVQSGELYFNDSLGNKNLIVDTRAYWDNVPEWQPSAQLLVSPTLDPDGELIFMPQYSKINYYNMDTGLNSENGLIGSRILVYNPGDLPVDFELKLGNLSSTLRRNLDKYTFRISRYNVQRLTIEQAVDWTGLETFKKEDNAPFKYGDKYFTIIEPKKNNLDKCSCCFKDPEEWDFQPYFRSLGCAHPKHTYIVEPIPRDRMSHFIKLFYWQRELQGSGNSNSKIKSFEDAVEMANRYEELYKNCIDDNERYELYWATLKDLLKDMDIVDIDVDSFLRDYIYNPPEFIVKNTDLNYGEFEFNPYNYPSHYTYDYFDINNNGFSEIYGGEVNKFFEPLEDARREYTLPLFLDSERRMLYNINKNTDRYNFKLTKNIHNENIEQGHWFKLPPGWSLIDISPIIDDEKWGGKRWLDARPFEWGNIREGYRTWYDKVYQIAAIDYLSENITQQGLIVGNNELTDKSIDSSKYDKPSELKAYFESLELWELENYMQFARWYNYDDKDIYAASNLEAQINKKKADSAEIGFLKTLANYWRVNRICKCNGEPRIVGDINDWWWYANNYIWENFPPLYWGYADLINKAEIKYIPLFY